MNIDHQESLEAEVVRLREVYELELERVRTAEGEAFRLARRVTVLEAALRAIENDAKLLRSLLPNDSVAAKLADGIREGAALAGDGGGARATICEECGSGILDGEHIADYPCSRSNASEVCAHGCGREATVMKADGRVLCRVCYQAEAGMEGSVPGCPTCGDGGGA